MWSQYGIQKTLSEKENCRKGDVDDEFEELELLDDEILAYVNTRKKTSAKKMPTLPTKRKSQKKTNRAAQNRKGTQPDGNSQPSPVSCIHPIDNKRRLWFISDFPHLVKSIKQRIVNSEVLEVSHILGPKKLSNYYLSSVMLISLILHRPRTA